MSVVGICCMTANVSQLHQYSFMVLRRFLQCKWELNLACNLLCVRELIMISSARLYFLFGVSDDNKKQEKNKAQLTWCFSYWKILNW